jgi:hypothetical protein
MPDIEIDSRLLAIVEAAPPFLTRRQATDFLSKELNLPMTKGQLERLACFGGGPDYEIYGNRSVYRPVNLVRWALRRLKPRGSTSKARAEGSA